jgi:ectoine hydroxylase-related dioxygenase (phytanoyl-CoA dioxygenase family)
MVMKNSLNHSKALLTQGFTVLDGIYTAEELEQLISIINAADQSGDTFRKTDDLFAIRQFLKEIPAALPVIFNKKLTLLIAELFGDEYFVSKSIYFDKPQKSNWFVAWHRDLTISVNKKVALPGFTNWTVKQNQFAVQPPTDILKQNFTIRIHLDDTDSNNGALKVIPGSHLDEEFDTQTLYRSPQVFCDVKAGGVMLMRPLLMHASNRTVNNNRRRVLHIEFSDAALPEDIEWSERIDYFVKYTERNK